MSGKMENITHADKGDVVSFGVEWRQVRFRDSEIQRNIWFYDHWVDSTLKETATYLWEQLQQGWWFPWIPAFLRLFPWLLSLAWVRELLFLCLNFKLGKSSLFKSGIWCRYVIVRGVQVAKDLWSLLFVEVLPYISCPSPSSPSLPISVLSPPSDSQASLQSKSQTFGCS